MFTLPEENGGPEKSQPNQYDKLLKENIEISLPGLMEKVLHIHVVHSEELPDDLQYTKERKPDVLKRITDDEGNTFVLHIEFQTGYASKMVFRMADYFVMLARQYKLPIHQFVIYIGEGKSTMRNELKSGKNYFFYDLISLSCIDYRLFLNSDKLEERMLAILGDYGEDSPEIVISKITTDILQNSKGELELEQRKNQLRLFAQLRTLVSEKLETMLSASTFFKEENDFLFRKGKREGKQEGKQEGIQEGIERRNHEIVKTMLLAGKFTISEIATYADVTEDFVIQVKNALH